MDVAEITVDKDTARQQFERYRALVRQRATKEDLAPMRGFKALSKGQQVIDLFFTMKKVALDELYRPRLAICRANAEKVYYRHGEKGDGTFSADQSWWRRASRLKYIDFPQGTFPTVLNTQIRWNTLKALVPVVPAHLRPAAALSNYHILWEPEWSEEPPRDPILLKRIARFTFIVLAQWDLSELERSILRGV